MYIIVDSVEGAVLIDSFMVELIGSWDIFNEVSNGIY